MGGGGLLSTQHIYTHQLLPPLQWLAHMLIGGTQHTRRRRQQFHSSHNTTQYHTIHTQYHTMPHSSHTIPHNTTQNTTQFTHNTTQYHTVHTQYHTVQPQCHTMSKPNSIPLSLDNIALPAFVRKVHKPPRIYLNNHSIKKPSHMP